MSLWFLLIWFVIAICLLMKYDHFLSPAIKGIRKGIKFQRTINVWFMLAISLFNPYSIACPNFSNYKSKYGFIIFSRGTKLYPEFQIFQISELSVNGTIFVFWYFCSAFIDKISKKNFFDLLHKFWFFLHKILWRKKINGIHDKFNISIVTTIWIAERHTFLKYKYEIFKSVSNKRTKIAWFIVIETIPFISSLSALNYLLCMLACKL